MDVSGEGAQRRGVCWGGGAVTPSPVFSPNGYGEEYDIRSTESVGGREEYIIHLCM